MSRTPRQPPDRAASDLPRGVAVARALGAALTLVSVLALAPVAVLDVLDTRRLVLENGQDRLLRSAERTAERIEAHFAALFSWADELSARPHLRAWLEGRHDQVFLGRPQWEAEILEPFRRRQRLVSVTVLARDGAIVLSSGGFRPPQAAVEWPPFQAALSGSFGIDVQVAPDQPGRAYVAAPIRTPAGSVVAVTVLVEDLGGTVTSLVAADNAVFGPESFGVLADERWLRLVHGTRRDLVGISVGSPELAQRLAELRSGGSRDPFVRHLQPTTGQVGYGAVVPLRRVPWVYYMGVPADVIDGPARDQLVRALLIALGAMIVSGIAAQLLARPFTRPVRALARTAARWGGGDHTARAGGSRLRELDELATAFNAMAEQVEGHAETLAAQVRDRTRELELAHVALKEAYRELEMFSSSASHDLRSPLRSIDGLLDAVLEDHGPELSPEGRDLLRRVRRSAQAMGMLVEELLDFARVSRAEVKREPVDLSALAREIAAELRAAEPDRDVELVVEDGLVADADPGLTRCVLANLIGNAWKYTGKRPFARIEVGRAEAGFYVRDDGAGFDSAQASGLFQPFHRMHDKREFAGTGIGLATVKRIVDRHGGTIRGESTVGAGATFTFTL